MSGSHQALFETRNNNFNLIRMIAAIMVLFAHSFPLSGHAPSPSFMSIDTYGGVAVTIFFTLSGFLICKSALSKKGFAAYVEGRVLRIFPGLIVANVLCVFLLGIFVSTLSVGDYFSHQQIYRFLGLNSTLVLDKIMFHLPGVFLKNPMTAVNGSLWTLPFELYLYIALLLLAMIRVIHYRWLMNLISVVLYVGFIWAVYHGPLPGQWFYFLRLPAVFFVGVFFYQNRDWLKLDYRLLVVMLALFLGVHQIGSHQLLVVVFPIVLAYAVFVLAFCVTGSVLNYNRLGDYSYGMYIYAFPVQQTLVWLFGGEVSVMVLFVLAFLVTMCFSVLSWHFIESPALSLRGRLSNVVLRLGRRE